MADPIYKVFSFLFICVLFCGLCNHSAQAEIISDIPDDLASIERFDIGDFPSDLHGIGDLPDDIFAHGVSPVDLARISDSANVFGRVEKSESHTDVPDLGFHLAEIYVPDLAIQIDGVAVGDSPSDLFANARSYRVIAHSDIGEASNEVENMRAIISIPSLGILEKSKIIVIP